MRGLADLPMWVLLASQFSRAPLSLSASPGRAKAAAEEWIATFATCGVGEPTKEGSVVAGRFKGWGAAAEVRRRVACLSVCDSDELRSRCSLLDYMPPLMQDAGRFLLVVNTEAEGATLQARIKEFNPVCAVAVAVVGPGGALTDGASVEDYVAMIGGAVDAVDTGKQQPFKGVVFMAGCHDESVIGEVAFSRCVVWGVCVYMGVCDARTDVLSPYLQRTVCSSSRRRCSRARRSPRASGW